MTEKFIIISKRKLDGPLQTECKIYGEICEIEITASSRIVDLFLEYNDGFEEWLRRRIKND
jgi:hypothetical protein